ncbi:MAG: 5'/3'-nucleotidase SurE [Phycisphaeraceae bacterium]|nr:5'/3'-nucleotidase SurE [Phycisphaeraceae bacterium]
MRILLTNDDGIRAPGLIALHGALVGASEFVSGRIGGEGTQVFVVAPETVQSATSHGVTFHEPLMTREVRVAERFRGVAVEGRPADCVKLAISQLWPEHFGDGSRPDLVISGMNAGANCGVNVIYSGTVAAAIEAAFLGVPAIAVSLHIGPGDPWFEAAAWQGRRAVEAILATGELRPHDCLNVNIPRIENPSARASTARRRPVSRVDESLPPIGDPLAALPMRVCPMNTHGLVDAYERRESPAGDVYYWASGHGLEFKGTEPDSDVDLLLRRHITITPLMYDLTRIQDLGRWASIAPDGP